GPDRAGVMGEVQRTAGYGGKDRVSRAGCADADHVRESATLLLHPAVDLRAQRGIPAFADRRKADVDILPLAGAGTNDAAQCRIRSLGRLRCLVRRRVIDLPALQMVRSPQGAPNGLVA